MAYKRNSDDIFHRIYFRIGIWMGAINDKIITDRYFECSIKWVCFNL